MLTKECLRFLPRKSLLKKSQIDQSICDSVCGRKFQSMCHRIEKSTPSLEVLEVLNGFNCSGDFGKLAQGSGTSGHR